MYAHHVPDRTLTYLCADDLDSINGIGLPLFNSLRPPNPQPPDRRILNNSDHSQLDNFLNSFDDPSMPVQNVDAELSLGYPHGSGPFMGMPPSFVGSESVLPENNEHGFHDWHMANFTYLNNMPHTDIHTNPALQHAGFLSVSQTGPRPTHLGPIYSNNYQQQPFQPQGQPLQTPGRGPVPHFGTDAHFQPTGFNHVTEQAHNSPIHDDTWLASNPSTRPNTRPNTQPSSPVMSRKRKSEVDHANQRNGFVPHISHGRNSSQAGIANARLSYIKAEPIQEPTPHSSLDNQSPDDSDADAGAESDIEHPSQTATPPAQRHPTRSVEPGSSKAKRKSTSTKNSKAAAKATTRPKTTQRNSSNTQSRRQPLSIDQKKANHTNSEQRRRDATARAQARLFDLVPQVRAAPQKQSTVQKLAKVVEYIKEMEQMEDALTEVLYPGRNTARRDRTLLDATATDDVDAAAADALAGMGSAESSLMFGDAGGLGGGAFR
jgi:hypothetical protein